MDLLQLYSIAHLEKLTSSQLAKKFHAFYEKKKPFSKNPLMIIPSQMNLLITSSILTFNITTLILSSNLHLDLPSCLFLKSLALKFLITFHMSLSKWHNFPSYCCVTFCYMASWGFEKPKVSRPFQQLIKTWTQTPFVDFEWPLPYLQQPAVTPNPQ